MTERKEILDYGMTLPDVYVDAPFHDDNWILLRYKKNKRAFAWTYERNGNICVNVKVDPEWRDFWRNAYSLSGQNAGIISIPVYLGNSLLDEVIVDAQQRQNLRSGGR